jgi:hypothetical protein
MNKNQMIALLLLVVAVSPVALGLELSKRVEELLSGSVGDWKRQQTLDDLGRKDLKSALMIAALDPVRSNEDRITAVMLLAKMPDEEVIAFLLDNASLHLPKDVHMGDADLAQEDPCLFALEQIGWQTVPQILTRLDQDLSESDLMRLGKVLARVVRQDAAAAILTVESNHWSTKFRENAAKLLKAWEARKPK